MTSDDDPIMAALAGVEADDDLVDDPGEGIPEMGEEADAMPEGPAPEGDADEQADGEEWSVLSWASEIPEGSHTEADARDWWDPDGGGLNRVAFHLSQATDSGAVGYPNGVGVLVGIAEEYVSRVGIGGFGSDSDETDEQDAPNAETVDRETAEALT